MSLHWPTVVAIMISYWAGFAVRAWLYPGKPK